MGDAWSHGGNGHHHDVVASAAQEIQRTYGAHLRSVMVYGSVVTGDFSPAMSNVNVLVVLDRVNWSALTKWSAQESCRRTGPGHLAVQFLSVDELAWAAQMWPMHFLDLKDHGTVMAGDAVLVSIAVPSDPATLLRHCETALHLVRASFRTGYAEASDDADRVRPLLSRAWSESLSIARHLLRCAGQRPPLGKMAALNLIKTTAALNDEPFRAIQRMREDPWSPPAKSAADMVDALLGQLDQFVRYTQSLRSRSGVTPSPSA